jgi:hypothetical protein
LAHTTEEAFQKQIQLKVWMDTGAQAQNTVSLHRSAQVSPELILFKVEPGGEKCKRKIILPKIFPYLDTHMAPCMAKRTLQM